MPKLTDRIRWALDNHVTARQTVTALYPGFHEGDWLYVGTGNHRKLMKVWSIDLPALRLNVY